MKQTSASKTLQTAMLIGIACLLMSAKGCVTSTGTTGIDAPAIDTRPARLSLCEIISREELQYSRRDTPETKDALGGVLEKYDRNCGTRPAA